MIDMGIGRLPRPNGMGFQDMRVPGIVWEGVPIEQETPVLVGFIGDTVLVGRPPSLPNTEKIESPQADWSLMF